MKYAPHISLNTFKEVSIGDKAKALQMFGTLLVTTSAYGMNFFLYAMDDYFVEVTSQPKTGDVIYIRATDRIGVCDLYLETIRLPEF